MERYILIVLLCFGAVLHMNCGNDNNETGESTNTSVIEGKNEAEEFMSNVYQLIQQQQFDAALEYYSGKFFTEISRDEWLSELMKINKQLGNLDTYELTFWHDKQGIGVNADHYMQMTYKTQYSKYEAIENLYLLKSGSSYVILTHQINSEGLSPEA